MIKDDLYPIIFKRKSIREYDVSPLDEDTLEEISGQIQNLNPLYSDIKTEIKIVSSNEVKQRMMKKSTTLPCCVLRNQKMLLD